MAVPIFFVNFVPVKRIIFILTLMACAIGMTCGARPTETPDSTLRASIITCSPGPKIYELAGHVALRIRGEGLDSVWNYGLYDFNQPNFVYRFVRGETDYMVAGYPFAWFLPEYVARGSEVVEQDLNLSPEEVARLRKMLQTESLPGNCVYRYNYLRDNCATRVRDRIEEVLGSKPRYTAPVWFRSYRAVIRHMNKGYPWYQFGIDMVLGSKLDESMTRHTELFAPMIFEDKIGTAIKPDGKPLIDGIHVLATGKNNRKDCAKLPPTPWWRSPMAVALLILAVSIAVAAHDIIRHTVTRWWYTVWFSVVGLIGCLIAFLVFFSSHEATSPNLLLIWANPLIILIPAFAWYRKAWVLPAAAALYESIATGMLLLLWPVLHQETDPAIIVLMIASVISAGAYAINMIINRYFGTLRI